ncbi:MAG: hypothetical protein M3P84_06520 [Chloroflexota bacterium]|nr:hypothetical protein [Chloroflexota bacterium]
MMDHAEVRELLELATVEPDGLDRLAAGDTPAAAAIAGHLAGCAECAEEARRLSVVGQLVRDAVETAVPPELRSRTLELVRTVGRPRRGVATATVPAATQGRDAAIGSAAAPTGRQQDAPAPQVQPGAGHGRRRVIGWAAALAAVLVVALVGGGLLGLRLVDDQRAHAAALAALNTATLRVSAEPDALRVILVGAANGAGAALTGTLLFSAKTEELVVSAPGLREPPAGQVFACWITLADGSRARLGTMDFGGGLAYWEGWAEELKDAGPGTTFGITLVDATGRPVQPGDVLTGTAERG